MMEGLEDLKQWVAAGGSAGAVFGAVFFALRWFVNWIAERHDKRQASLDAEHAELDQSWKSYRLVLERELGTIKRELNAVRFAFQRVSAALIEVDPTNPAIAEAAHIMAIAFPADFSLDVARAEAALNGHAKEGGKL
ncbi:hypothetical protein [Sphingomonas sp. LaA6.9]|uniref:hypothetical protein n=1 Tax=Sphingomonas sp. LaA6.9 TaxID=2919914 RepID=UPI001F4F4F6E|nr:hypothetical protein [Sphingomonas sp. LaA6.9]MCJ8159902.1 hypothetical protein [Sphingomonas sp. LaA6.9]